MKSNVKGNKPKCCTDGVITGGTGVIYTDHWHIELNGMHQMMERNDNRMNLQTRCV